MLLISGWLIKCVFTFSFTEKGNISTLIKNTEIQMTPRQATFGVITNTKSKCCLISEIDCQWASSKANLVGSQDVKYTSKFHGRSHTARLKANKSTDDKQYSETWCTTDSSFESETDWGTNIIAPCFHLALLFLPQLIMQAAAVGRFCV